MRIHKVLGALALVLLCALGSASVSMAASPAAKSVNHTLPKVSPPTEMSFSSPPLDAEFLRTGLFAEPLAPVAATTAEENRDLAQALFAYREATRQSGAIDAVDPLLSFLIAHPASPWMPALELNLGLIYRQTGHFSKALEVWQAGWEGSKDLSEQQGRALANAMVAQLSQLEAYLGRKEILQPLLSSIDGRPIGGSAAQLITDSHTGMYAMVYHPEESFRCGPLALLRILKYREGLTSSPRAMQILEHESPSTDHGLSLSSVQEIAERAGMPYQMAYRTRGAKVIYPAVAHWNVGHYAAIVDRTSSGRYAIEDTTFGEDIRMSEATLDEESSGYFLIPQGPLPEGWRAVAAQEGAQVWGRGYTGHDHDDWATGNDCDTPGGCTSASVELSVVGLQLNDTPVGYAPPVGPQIRFHLVYSHRDTQQPTTFSYTNFGSKWTFNWLSYVTDTISSNKMALLYQRGGGAEPYTFSMTTATTAYPGPYSQSTLTRSVNGSGNSTSFTLTHPDGSYEQYGQALGSSQFFMTALSDAAGNIVTLTYDAQMRITAITDAIGQVTTLTYGLSGSPLVVTQITDPFGRSASFSYNGNGLLASITDVLGITSSYTYGQGSDPNFINKLTTPYGSTTFTFGDLTTNPSLGDTRFLTTVDPLGRTSYVEFDQYIDAGDTSGGSLINSNLQPTGMNTCNNYMQYRNTFIFDPNQYQLATASGSLNYALGKAIHWLHSSDGTTTSRVKESEKEPLENRVWYNYPAQGGGCGGAIFFPVSSGGTVTNGASNQPSAIGRVLDSGATQLSQYQYNANGQVTQYTDPLGRTWAYTYATNGIDRLTTSNTTNGSQLLETRTYNSDHLPLAITGANGKTSHYQYNAAGQPTRYTDPLGDITTFNYDTSGHLKTLRRAIAAAKYTFAYDNVSRVASATDPAGMVVKFAYDAADRKTKVTYPDGTTQNFAYTLLDLTLSTDRLSQTTHYNYDADRELLSTVDPKLNQVTYGYNPAGKLNSITDANGRTTSFTLDAESRLTTKQFANGSSQSVSYEKAVSRIATLTDAVSQTIDYTYNTDNTLATISYEAHLSTPAVSFTYDPSYVRQTGMTDGTGTTSYSYFPVSHLGANRLKSTTIPIAGTSSTDTVVYAYDALNRVVSMTVDGDVRATGYDAIGRVISQSGALDSFTYSYTDGTPRVTGVSSNAGPTAALSYFGPTGDELLEQLNYKTHSGGTSLAQFGYTYNSDDNAKTLTVSSPSAETLTYGYDPDNRLTSALIGTGTPQYQYAYDHDSNLTSITPNGPTQTYSYTSVNTITAGTYDANGSPTSLAGASYKWDGANRLVQYSNPAANTGTRFSYDGKGRLVRIVDTHAGAITADHSYTWCGNVRCLAHDNTQSNSPVSTQYYDQGAIIAGTPYYYVKDRLGSVMQLISNTGTIAAQYTYDPYGNKTTVSGTLVSDIGYAGYYYHAVSGLNFALHRAYDPTHARWLNRDPIGEAGGINLYAYSDDDPVTDSDPSGLTVCIKGTTDRAQAALQDAYNQIRQTRYGAYLLEMLENSSTQYLITDAFSKVYPGNFIPEINTLSIDPFPSLENSVVPGADQTYVDVTVATTIAHEAGHALTPPFDRNNPDETDAIEQIAIDQFENPVRAELGLPYRGRYYGIPPSLYH